jgi:dienelactone hydrolase
MKMRAMALTLLLAGLCPQGQAQEVTVDLAIERTFKGRPVTLKPTLVLPSQSGRFSAVILHHGSGGVSQREHGYARELGKLGVATLVLDSFKARGVGSTVRDQAALSSFEMLEDAFAALKALAKQPQIDATRVGIVGFSKGGSVALLAAHERRAARSLPDDLRFALHVPFYPACTNHYYKPRTTGAPIYLLLGGADTYVGVAPCQEYAAVLKAEGARIETTVFPGAQHGFDGGSPYRFPRGENWSRCVFVEQPDGTWKERTSGIATNTADGKRIETGYRQALARCRTYGVSGGPDEAAKANSMAALKSYVRRHLLAEKGRE